MPRQIFLHLLANTGHPAYLARMPDTLPPASVRQRKTQAKPAVPSRSRGKVAVTVRLDGDLARRLETMANAENRSLTNFVETALLRHLAQRDEAERVITMYVAPGVSDTIRPEDVVREDDETDEDYAARQKLMVELWSIPDNA
jgi:hypothetical protein